MDDEGDFGDDDADDSEDDVEEEDGVEEEDVGKVMRKKRLRKLLWKKLWRFKRWKLVRDVPTIFLEFGTTLLYAKSSVERISSPLGTRRFGSGLLVGST